MRKKEKDLLAQKIRLHKKHMIDTRTMEWYYIYHAKKIKELWYLRNDYPKTYIGNIKKRLHKNTILWHIQRLKEFK